MNDIRDKEDKWKKKVIFKEVMGKNVLELMN